MFRVTTRTEPVSGCYVCMGSLHSPVLCVFSMEVSSAEACCTTRHRWIQSIPFVCKNILQHPLAAHDIADLLIWRTDTTWKFPQTYSTYSTAPPTQRQYEHAPDERSSARLDFQKQTFCPWSSESAGDPGAVLSRMVARLAEFPRSNPSVRGSVRPSRGTILCREQCNTTLRSARRDKRHLSCTLKKAAARISSRITSCLMRASATEPFR